MMSKQSMRLMPLFFLGLSWSGMDYAAAYDNSTTLSVTSPGVIPVNTGSGIVTVTNTGLAVAHNIAAQLPVAWTAVIQDASQCLTLNPSDSCQISFTSTQPYVAEGNIVVTGDNVISPPTIALGFSLSGYLVVALESGNRATLTCAFESPSDSPEKLCSTRSIPTESYPWGNMGITGASSLTDGADNTLIIYHALGINSAAGFCYNSIAGGFPQGSWYLPAICQLGGEGLGAGCLPSNANLNNLYQLGLFTGEGGSYTFLWSSTECAQFPVQCAWQEFFSKTFLNYQGSDVKTAGSVAVCFQSISY